MQWRILAYPRGRDGKARHLSLYLAAAGDNAFTPFSSWQQPARFRLEVANCGAEAESWVSGARSAPVLTIYKIVHT